MRSLLLFVAAVAGCTGEQVLIQTSDAVAESSADSAVVTDSISSDDVDASADATCAKPSGNLVPDGDFSIGLGAWRASDCQITRVPGPCGDAMRVYDITKPARVEVSYSGVALPKDTALRLRAWFKKGSQAIPTGARLFVRSYSSTDGGEVSRDYEINASLTEEWVLVDRLFTLENAQTGFQVMIDVYREPGATPQDLLIADISLVTATP